MPGEGTGAYERQGWARDVMPGQPLQWDARGLWQQLEPLLPGLSVEVLPRTGSTNTALLERARAVPEHRRREQPSDDPRVVVRRSVESTAFGRRAIDLDACLLVAEHQTSGRGRKGRLWHSEPGASLTFSLALPLALVDWSGLSLAVGVALCEALDPVDGAPRSSSTPNDPPRGSGPAWGGPALGPAEGAPRSPSTPNDPPRGSGPAWGGPALAPALLETPGPRIGLKWPNDLWLVDAASGGPAAGRKLGGILIETVAAGALRLVIVGVGLNVARFDPPRATTGFAALCELDPSATPPQVLARVAAPLVHALKRFEREGFAPFAERFAARDVLFGQAVRTTQAEVPEGVARGVSAQGALQVETATGIASVSSGEVSVRLASPAAG